MTGTRTVLLITLKDEHGRPLNRAIPIAVEYIEHNGEVCVLDTAIDAGTLLTLTSDQVERALADIPTTLTGGSHV